MNSNTLTSPHFEGGQGGLNLFIIGPSGCGKSTQAKKVADKYSLTHFSTGQIFRDEISAGTELGIRAKAYIDQGKLCPDDSVLAVVKSSFAKVNDRNFILDGTPRRCDQALEIQDYLKSKGEDISLIIHLKVTFEEIMKRRAKMGDSFQDKDRTDNTPEAVAKRQSEYDHNIGLIIDKFSRSGKIVEVDGNRPIEPIFEDICLAIDSI